MHIIEKVEEALTGKTTLTKRDEFELLLYIAKRVRGETVFEEKERQQKDPVWEQAQINVDEEGVVVDPSWEREEPDWSDQQQTRNYVKAKLNNMSKWLDHFAKWQTEQDKAIEELWYKEQDEEIKVIIGRLDAQAKKIAELERQIAEGGVINLHTDPDPPPREEAFVFHRSKDLSNHICRKLLHGALIDLPGEKRHSLWQEIEVGIREWAAKEAW